MNKGILRTGITCARVFTLLALLIPGSAHAAEFDPFYQTSFESPQTIAEWAISSGNWQVANGVFVNSSAGALSIATVPTYPTRFFPQDSIGRDFSLHVYALIVSSATNARVGVVFDFAGPGNYHGVPAEARDINERGQIVGSGCTPFCPAVLWEPDGSIRSLEDLPGGVNWARARAINDRGEIVGDADGTAQDVEPVSWQGVTVEPLEPLGVEGFAFDVNNRGQIVGTVGTRSVGGRRAVMWQDHALTVLPSRIGQAIDPGGELSAATAINEHGVIVGSRATIWQEGRVADLNELLCEPLRGRMPLGRANDINERGEIAIDAWDGGNTITRAIVLTPVLGPEGCEQ